MATLTQPILFSQHFGLTQLDFKEAGLIDPILNCDTRLFIDPLLLSTSGFKSIKKEGFELLKKRFGEIISLVAASRAKNDIAWRTAFKMLDLNERAETALGYGGADISGSSRPDSIRQQVLSTAKAIIDLGESDPQIISLMGMFEEGIGPDTISDLTTNIIIPILCKITNEFCIKHKIPTKKYPRFSDVELPENPMKTGKPIVLVPSDIVRDLPLAADWSDVSKVVMEVQEIRDDFNSMIGKITEATLVEKKEALKKASLRSLERFRAVFEAVLGSSNHYDPNEDIFNFYNFRRLMSSDLGAFKTDVKTPTKKDEDELKRIVDEIIQHFKFQVENNNLWEMMWNGDRPKRERAAQLLFFGIADLFCKANDIDISPETNMGGGAVDFKFSSGYKARVVVEIKLSKGTVEHGYKKQLEVYKKAANTKVGIFLIMDVGGMGKKLTKITAIRDQKINEGETVSDIIVINSQKRPSASNA